MLHENNFLHRDLKPENFMMGPVSSSFQTTLYMIDFGLAKRWNNRKSGTHIPYRDGKAMTGTARYASINTHLGIEQSRRDDLESIGYILIYCISGSLPWKGLTVGKNKQEKYLAIKNLKVSTSLDSLCKGLPDEFAHYLQIVRHMKFDEDPNYELLKQFFRTLLKKMGSVNDSHFDWISQLGIVSRKSSKISFKEVNFSDLPVENNRKALSDNSSCEENKENT